jgi:hypothetical protein
LSIQVPAGPRANLFTTNEDVAAKRDGIGITDSGERPSLCRSVFLNSSLA